MKNVPWLLWLYTMLLTATMGGGSFAVQYERDYCQNITTDIPLNSTGYYRDRKNHNCTDYWAREANMTRILRHSLMLWNRTSSFVGQSLNAIRLRRMFRHLARSDSAVNIFVFGGSMTAGRFVKGHKGAWPAELQHLWNKQSSPGGSLQNITIRVTNQAHAATSSQWLLPRLSQYFLLSEPVDLVVLDYDVNDMAEWRDSDAARLDMQAHMEILARRLLLQPAGPAVIYLNVATSHRGNKEVLGIQPWCSEYRTAYQVGAVKAPVFSHPLYAVPIVSQKTAIWRNWVCPPTTKYMDCVGTGCAHPSWNAHLLFANIILHFLQEGAAWSAHSAPSSSLSSSSSAAAAAAAAADDDKELAGETAARAAMLQAPFLAEQSMRLDQRTCSDLHAVLDFGNAEQVLAGYADWLGHKNSSSDVSGNATGASRGVALVHLGACWGYRSDFSGKARGWIGGDTQCNVAALPAPPAASSNSSNTSSQRYSAQSIHFLVTLGSRATLNVHHLNTWNATAGLVIVATTHPLAPEDEAAALSLQRLPPDSSYQYLGIIDFHGDYKEQEVGHSVIVPSVFNNEPLLHPNATQVVRFTIVDANAEPWSKMQDRSKVIREVRRSSPQKAKFFALSTC